MTSPPTRGGLVEGRIVRPLYRPDHPTFVADCPMSHFRISPRSLWPFYLVVSVAAPPLIALSAQEADPRPQKPDTTNRYANTFTGEFTPGSGWTILNTKRGSLNISVYGLFRYMNQYA